MYGVVIGALALYYSRLNIIYHRELSNMQYGCFPPESAQPLVFLQLELLPARGGQKSLVSGRQGKTAGIMIR